MITYLNKILGKPNDYYICEECGALNFYENDGCRECNTIAPEINDEMNKKVLDWADEEYKFYQEELEYTEDECDNLIEIDC